jgi:hypothetical protein
MWTILSKSSVVSRRPLVVSGGILLALLCFSAGIDAQQPTATIKSLNGQVLVSIQGKAPVVGTKGTILQSGDIIETQSGAQAVLLLSEGSELRLGQNTKIDMATLAQRPETKARTSRIKLLYGKIQAFLSPGHQKEGSSFTIDTPNATAGVKFSRPVIEASYDPKTKTSLFKTYTVPLTITNRSTKKVSQVPQGSQAIIRNESTLISLISAPPRSRLLQQSRSAVRGVTSTTVPLSVGVVGTGETEEPEETGGTVATETSTNPSPGARPENRVRPRPVTITILQEE